MQKNENLIYRKAGKRKARTFGKNNPGIMWTNPDTVELNEHVIEEAVEQVGAKGISENLLSNNLKDGHLMSVFELFLLTGLIVQWLEFLTNFPLTAFLPLVQICVKRGVCRGPTYVFLSYRSNKTYISMAYVSCCICLCRGDSGR